MKIFLDTAVVSDVQFWATTGLVNGVTTNPTLIMKSGRPLTTVIEEMCGIVNGPVSAEVATSSYENMLAEGRELARIALNVVVKLPLTPDGLKVCNQLSSEGIKTNVTLCFSPTQALLAAKAGATFVSPFVGRLDDISQNGSELLADIMGIFSNYESITTEVLAASIRNPAHVLEAARIGVHAMTVPPKVLEQLYNHPLTDAGLKIFENDSRTS